MVVPKKGKRGPVSEGRCHVTLARDLSRPLREIAGWGAGPWPRPGEKAVLAPIQAPDVNVSPNNGINIGVGGQA